MAQTTALGPAAQPQHPRTQASAQGAERAAPHSAAAASTRGTSPVNPVDEARQAAENTPAGQRTRLNAQILQASLDVSIRAGDDSQALLYRTAIDRINEVLAPELGPDALQNAMQQDNSAEATAGRILAQSTAFFDAYAARYPDKDAETVARDFVALIRGGFEKGFNEAQDILQGLGVLGEGSPVAAGIAKTYELVHKGYDDFLAAKIAAIRGGNGSDGASASTSTDAAAKPASEAAAQPA